MCCEASCRAVFDFSHTIYQAMTFAYVTPLSFPRRDAQCLSP